MEYPIIFVSQPFSEADDRLFEVISSAAALAGARTIRSDDIPHDKDILSGIQETIRNAFLIIADVTDANPSVMYEVGHAQALGKPLILLADSSRSVPFDLAGLRVIIYDLRSPSEIVSRLAKAIADAVESPGDFQLGAVSAERNKLQRIFISYCHHDREYLDRLLIHLKPLEKEGLIDLWTDRKLRPGDRWKKEIEMALHRANVAVLLVSADFLASDFIIDNELPPLLRNAEDKGTRIIPLILKPCRFSRDANLRQFHAINDPIKPLIRLTEGEREMFYDSVASEIERSLKRG